MPPDRQKKMLSGYVCLVGITMRFVYLTVFWCGLGHWLVRGVWLGGVSSECMVNVTKIDCTCGECLRALCYMFSRACYIHCYMPTFLVVTLLTGSAQTEQVFRSCGEQTEQFFKSVVSKLSSSSLLYKPVCYHIHAQHKLDTCNCNVIVVFFAEHASARLTTISWLSVFVGFC